MGRTIFNIPTKDSLASELPAPPSVKTTKVPGSVSGLRDSLREITANSIRDLDPDRIETDGRRDRITIDDESLTELAESIRKHGQQVPIMVRPSDRPDLFRVVYGRRRLAAIRKIGGTVKAIVRTLDDDASLIAQGQENNLRVDPSFIEKALFIRDMQDASYKPSVIQDALGLTRQGVSNHRTAVDRLPEDVIRMIGPAHGVGRRQWADLAELATQIDLLHVASDVLSGSVEIIPSSDRFKAVLRAAKDAVSVGKELPAAPTDLTSTNGASIGDMQANRRHVSIRIDKRSQPEFSDWLESNAEALLRSAFERWQNERGSSS